MMTYAIQQTIKINEWVQILFEGEKTTKVKSDIIKQYSDHVGKVEKIFQHKEEGLLYKLHNSKELFPLWCLKRLLHYDLKEGRYF